MTATRAPRSGCVPPSRVNTRGDEGRDRERERERGKDNKERLRGGEKEEKKGGLL